MENNHIKIVQDMLKKENKHEIARKLENAYYENILVDNWNGGMGSTNIFVNPEYFMELEKLDKENIALLVKIFNALPHEYEEISFIKFSINTKPINNVKNKELATFWKQGYLKLFISHLAKHKEKASTLQKELMLYGISGFVAHVDIEPSKEWQGEIEKALHTMDALTAILMDGFKESHWCDQEVGFAVGKNVLIIPIKKELDPYGFIGKYQAIQGNNTTVKEVAKAIFNTIIKNPKTRSNMLTILSNLIATSTNENKASLQLEIFSEIDNLPKEILTQMAEQINNNSVLHNSTNFLKKLEKLFAKYQMTLSNKILNNSFDVDDDEIPF